MSQTHTDLGFDLALTQVLHFQNVVVKHRRTLLSPLERLQMTLCTGYKQLSSYKKSPNEANNVESVQDHKRESKSTEK